MPELIAGDDPLWEELFAHCKDISDWLCSGYEMFAVSELEDYVQDRINRYMTGRDSSEDIPGSVMSTEELEG